MATHTEIVAIADIVAREVSSRIAALSVPGRWLNMKEAQAYAKVRSITTIKKWVNEGHIYGRPRSGRGDWIIDRDSIDKFYLEEKIG
ncbi:MAG: helix-turn-helix domain-containing protein [Deltaproteobacteria bacterium]|nr:helix-turn-helix domain-containing protein [Deltaproteobacteria bacterium]